MITNLNRAHSRNCLEFKTVCKNTNKQLVSPPCITQDSCFMVTSSLKLVIISTGKINVHKVI